MHNHTTTQSVLTAPLRMWYTSPAIATLWWIITWSFPGAC